MKKVEKSLDIILELEKSAYLCNAFRGKVLINEALERWQSGRSRRS